MVDINSEQIRAARGLLKWTQDDLAKRAGISLNSVKNIENEITDLTSKMAEKIYDAFFQYGIEFMPNSGVRRLDNRILIYENEREYNNFFLSVLEVAQKTGGPIRIDGVSVNKFFGLWGNKEQLTSYTGAMGKIENLDIKAILKKNDFEMLFAPYVDYRQIDEEYFSPVVYYIYGDRVALILWSKPHKIISIKDPELVSMYHKQFLVNWNRSEEVSENKFYLEADIKSDAGKNWLDEKISEAKI